MVDLPQDTATAPKLPTVSSDGPPQASEGDRRRWTAMAAVAMLFLAVSVLVLGLVVRDGRGPGSGSVTASEAGGAEPDAPGPGEPAAADTAKPSEPTEAPATTEAPPETLQVPLEWSADGLAALPFGTPKGEAIAAMTAALGSPPDEVREVEMSECTPGTSMRWEAENVQMSADEAGNLASVYFPATLGSVGGDAPTETLADVRGALPQVSVEYLPPNPDWGEDKGTYRWTVQGSEANASGPVDSDSDQAALEMTWLTSERYQGVTCYE